RLVDHLGQDRAAAETRVQDARRHLARAEAGHPHLSGQRLVRLVEKRLQLVELDLDGEFDPRGVDMLDSALHVLRLLAGSMRCWFSHIRYRAPTPRATRRKYAGRPARF